MANEIVDRYNRFVTAWKNTAPPARPMASELRQIAELIGQTDHTGGKLLLLGATPEYRDLSIRAGYSTYALDINQSMLIGMEDLMAEAGNPLNHRVEGDWRQMPFADHEVDIILAEQSLNILPIADWGKVLQECRRVLKTKGKFFCKTMVIENHYRHSIAECTKEYLGGAPFNDYVMCLLQATDSGCYDPTTHKMALTDGPIIERLVNKGKLDVEVLARHQRQYPAHYAGHQLYLLPEVEAREIMEKYFTILTVLRGTEFAMARAMPIFVSVK